MNTLKRTQAIAMPMRRELRAANDQPWNHSSLARARSLAKAKRRREQVLAMLAFVMLIVAWNATLRLDEHVSPPRMRMAHAVEVEGEQQGIAAAE